MKDMRNRVAKILGEDLPWLEEDLLVLADKIIKALLQVLNEEEIEEELIRFSDETYDNKDGDVKLIMSEDFKELAKTLVGKISKSEYCVCGDKQILHYEGYTFVGDCLRCGKPIKKEKVKKTDKCTCPILKVNSHNTNKCYLCGKVLPEKPKTEIED